MAILTVTIQEELILNGQDLGCTNVTTYACTELYHRIVTITNTEKSILLFGAAVEGGTIKDAQLDYLRITNNSHFHFDPSTIYFISFEF